MRMVGRWLLRIVIALVVIYFGTALALSAWPAPTFSTPADGSPEAAAAAGLSLEQVYPFEDRRFETRDGESLYARFFAAENPTLTILLVHGMTGESSQFNKSAGLLREATGAEVYALDLRGHGESGGRPGDVDHIGQYEEDLTDVVAALRSAHPDRGLVLSGHSMGGGIAQRFAQASDPPSVDGYLLYAPLMGQGANTNRVGEEPPEEGTEPWLKVDTPRIIGLIMLNTVGVTALNDLVVAACHVTESARVDTYTFRALAGTAPMSYATGVADIDAPFLVVIGSEDEAFIAEAYAPIVESHATVPAAVEVVEGVNHNAIIHDPDAVHRVAEWIAELGYEKPEEPQESEEPADEA